MLEPTDSNEHNASTGGDDRFREGKGAHPRKKIVSIEVHPDSRTLIVDFDDGTTADVDMNEYIERGGHYERLDDSEYFPRFELQSDGLVLKWPGDPPLDFSAGTLWKKFSPDAK